MNSSTFLRTMHFKKHLPHFAKLICIAALSYLNLNTAHADYQDKTAIRIEPSGRVSKIYAPADARRIEQVTEEVVDDYTPVHKNAPTSNAVLKTVYTAQVTESVQHTQSSEENDGILKQKRCGWFANPTPANASLLDKDGEWMVSRQGSKAALGDWPVFSQKNWVNTNAHYGYGCACIVGLFDAINDTVLQIHQTKVLPLKACLRDKQIKQWRNKL